MLKLKQVLAVIEQPQTELARELKLSKALVAQLINHSQWPRSLDLADLKQRIQGWLRSNGANDDAVNTAFEEMDLPRCNAADPALNQDNQEPSGEDEPMLMPKQVLLPATRKHFSIFRDPFDELQNAEDMYVNPDIRYIRESMYQVARHDGFLAVIGESGAGKSTLRRDLVNRLTAESAPVIVIEPYVLAMEDNDTKGKALRSTHIAEAIMNAVAPLEKPKSSPEARFAQMHRVLKNSHAAGFRHVVIIEEAHDTPIPTLKQLKRLRELEVGFSKLVSVILIGQSELKVKLSSRNSEVREVVQRIEIAELTPVSVANLPSFIEFRLRRAQKSLAEVITPEGLQALADRLSSSGRDRTSQLYPLAIGNMMVAAMNTAAQIGESVVTADVIREV